MKINKLKLQNEFIYPATIADAVKDANFTKDDNSVMTQGEINLYLNNKIDSSSYLSKTEADQRYIVKSSNVNSALIIKDSGQIDNLGDNSQAFNAIRDVSTSSDNIGSGFKINCASLGINTDGTVTLSHKKYDSFTYDKTNNTDSATGIKNTAVLTFSGNSGLLYAKNTGTAENVTDDMYKHVGVIDSPDIEQRVYSSSQVDSLIDKIKTVLTSLGATQEQINSIKI